MEFNQPELVQMRLAHLGMIQGIVGRMSVVSGNLKGFCITIVAGVLALQPGSWSGRMTVVGFLILAFAATDAAYLGMERQFRRLYTMVSDRPMSEAADLAIRRPDGVAETYQQALRSWAIWAFYIPLLLGAVVFGVFTK